jgi:C-terminal processing protease CtpA/Prc
VLVDAGSASASEIVAAALQEYGRATIVGQPTFGKNTVQVWNDLPNGGGLRLTTDRWFTPNHESVAPGGVQPDVLVEAPDDADTDEDPQLDAALEIRRAVRAEFSALCAISSVGDPSLARKEPVTLSCENVVEKVHPGMRQCSPRRAVSEPARPQAPPKMRR